MGRGHQSLGEVRCGGWPSVAGGGEVWGEAVGAWGGEVWRVAVGGWGR